MDRYIEHEYLVPVMIGCRSVNKTQSLLKLLKHTKQKIHIFAQNFSFIEKVTCYCHKVDPFRDDFLIDGLLSFASSLDEYCFPVIFIGCDEVKSFVLQNAEQIESAYVTVDLLEIGI